MSARRQRKRAAKRDAKRAAKSPIQLNVFRGKDSKIPERTETFGSFGDLADRLDGALTRALRDDKLDLPALNGAVLLEGGFTRPDGSVSLSEYNCDEGVDSYGRAILIDVDGGNPELVLTRAQELGRCVYLYGSPSDVATDPLDQRRFRIVVVLDRGLAYEEVKRARVSIAELLGLRPGQGVEKANSVSHIFFIGSVRGTPARQTWRHDGSEWPADEIDARPLTAGAEAWLLVDPAAREDVVERHEIRAPGGYREERVQAVLDLVSDEYAQGDRHEFGRALAGWLARCGGGPWSDEEITVLFEALPTERPAERVKVALETAARARRGGPTPGWTALEARLGERAAELERCAEHPWNADFRKRSIAKRDERREAAATTLAMPGEDPLLALTQSGNTYFVRDMRRDDAGYIECGVRAVIPNLRAVAQGYYPEVNDEGNRVTLPWLSDTMAHAIDGVEFDYTQPGRVAFDPTRNIMVKGIDVPEIAPCFDDAAHAWLIALTGNKIDALYEWVASTRQDKMHRIATAVLLVGPHSAGKSLFGAACAKLWGSAPVDLAHAVKQFNASMTSCPIVVDDECQTLAKRTVTTEQFRALVQERERAFEPKGKERRILRGAQRFVFSTNDLERFSFANAVGVGAVDAIAERLLLLVVHNVAGARRALDKLRDDQGEIDFDRLCGHLRWVQETISLPDGATRFLGSGPDKGGARRALLATHVDEYEAVFEVLKSAVAGEDESARGVYLAAGALWVRASELASALELTTPTNDRWDTAKVRRAIAPFRGPRRKFKHDGRAVAASEVGLDLLKPLLQ